MKAFFARRREQKSVAEHPEGSGDDRKQIGASGEDQAAAFLKKSGYRLLVRNWRHPLGEVDIIAADGLQLVFIEVKKRRGRDYGPAEEAVTSWKQQRLAQLAEAYVRQSGHEGDWRIDVVAIDPDGIRLIKDAVGFN